MLLHCHWSVNRSHDKAPQDSIKTFQPFYCIVSSSSSQQPAASQDTRSLISSLFFLLRSGCLSFLSSPESCVVALLPSAYFFIPPLSGTGTLVSAEAEACHTLAELRPEQRLIEMISCGISVRLAASCRPHTHNTHTDTLSLSRSLPCVRAN